MSGDDLLLCDHHEWVPALPLADNTLVCGDCGMRTKIGHWPAERCKQKLYKRRSGWLGKAVSGRIA